MIPAGLQMWRQLLRSPEDLAHRGLVNRLDDHFVNVDVWRAGGHPDEGIGNVRGG
jgi:hypothetical protein